MNRKVSGLCTSILVMSLLHDASAHHSAAAFNLDRIVAVEGTVTRFDWRNPHVYITVEDQDGADWLMEADGTALLSRSGWSRDSFQAGDAIAVRGFPDKDTNKTHALLLSITGSDGKQLTSMNRSNDRAVLSSVERASSLAGIWHGDLGLTGALLQKIAAHPLTEKGPDRTDPISGRDDSYRAVHFSSAICRT